MLRDAANSAAIGYVDAVDDAPMPNGDPEPTNEELRRRCNCAIAR
jgi:hypothetical protein